mmetsp:Transcript_8374/g.25306  ORF Transcript_8374/g.25306 Transcript_8374/m.25306 type:complete len:112 (-) Transcript_8374:574-909(-)
MVCSVSNSREHAAVLGGERTSDPTPDDDVSETNRTKGREKERESSGLPQRRDDDDDETTTGGGGRVVPRPVGTRVAVGKSPTARRSDAEGDNDEIQPSGEPACVRTRATPP